ncbi:MAG: nitrous oxide reductase family maturation protein NosD [Candidatus Hodarchaeota archaeon]
MKLNKAIIYIIVNIFFFSLLINSIRLHSYSTRVEFITKYENQKDKKPNSSSYWNLTGSPIYIDDSDPNYNWSKTATDNAWCSGSGTWNDPYLIENVTINGQGSGSCIEIKNSKKYFIIRNCTLYRSGSNPDTDGGIRLESVSNGKLINNTCFLNENGMYILNGCTDNNISENIVSNNTDNGIYLDHSNLNNISSNVANYNLIGINMNSVHYSNISGNIACNNFEDGLNFYIGSDNTFSRNKVYNNQESGIYISVGHDSEVMENFIDNNNDFGIYIGDSNYCSVSKNNITNNYYGIYLDKIRGCHEISDNIANNNVEGIYLENSDNNYILRNEIINNSYIGLDLFRSNYNKVIKNILFGNGRDWREEECQGNYYKGNIGIPDTPERFPWEILILIMVCIIVAMIAVGMIIYKRKSSRKEKESKKLLSSYKLKKEIRKTESEVNLEKESHICVVHRGKIVGTIYLCPKCEAYYCMKCAITLKEKGETCWVCNTQIDL